MPIHSNHAVVVKVISVHALVIEVADILSSLPNWDVEVLLVRLSVVVILDV
jgi:hypothetical protein